MGDRFQTTSSMGRYSIASSSPVETSRNVDLWQEASRKMNYRSYHHGDNDDSNEAPKPLLISIDHSKRMKSCEVSIELHMVWKNANKSFTFAWKTRLWMQQRQPYSSRQIQQQDLT